MQLRAHGAVAEQRPGANSVKKREFHGEITKGRLGAARLVRVRQRVVNSLEHQTPLVIAGLGIAVTAGQTCGPGPCQHIVERAAMQRAFPRNSRHEILAMAEVTAHGLVSGVSRRWPAGLFLNHVAVSPRSKRDLISKFERAPGIRARCSVISERRGDGAVLPVLQ